VPPLSRTAEHDHKLCLFDMAGPTDSAPSASTALATAPASTLVKTNVPPGVRIKWFQRKEHIWIDIEAADMQVEEVAWEDTGLVQVKAKDPKHCLTMQMLHRIHTYDSRWWMSGRCLKMEIAKAEYGRPHWDRLTVGEKLPNVLIDWTSWIDEAEEVEGRNRSLRLPARPAAVAAPTSAPRARASVRPRSHAPSARCGSRRAPASAFLVVRAESQQSVRARCAPDGERHGRQLGQQRRPVDPRQGAGGEGEHVQSRRRRRRHHHGVRVRPQSVCV
jgi:hypothetical protein